MRIAIGADHNGVLLKDHLATFLGDLGHQVEDFGTYDAQPTDFPDIAISVGSSVATGTTEQGILICGTGVGMAIAANKIAGIRAGLCHDQLSARQAREHNDTNMLCLGGLIIGVNLAKEIVDTYLKARYQGAMPEGSRYLRRVTKIKGMDQ